jgi:hypothetical protein
MERGAEIHQKLQAITGSDWNVQHTDNSRYAVLSRGESNYFDIQVGPRYDGSLAVVATHRRDFGSVGTVPYPVEYRRSESVEAAVENVSEIIKRYCDSQHWSVRSVDNAVSADDVVDYFVDNGVLFVAAPEDLLAYGVGGLLWTAPRGTDVSAVVEYLKDIDTITVDGRPLPFAGSSEISLPDAHFGTRVPIYASGEDLPVIDTIESNEGLERLREYDSSASPQSDLAIDPQAINLGTLLERIVDAGAVAIALEKEVSRLDRPTFSVYIPPAKGYDIVTEYPFVRFDDSEPEVDWVCRMDGPHFGFRLPVYASDDITGLESVSLPEGMANLRKFVSGDTDDERDTGGEL